MQTLKPRVKTLSTTIASSVTQITRIRGLYAIRKAHFLKHPLCAECERQGRTALATDLDHITPLWAGGHETDVNRQGLCATCHKAKTADEARLRASMGLAPLPDYTRKRSQEQA
jgi:5-methylcytosine-specific restriction endonuclease McrA